MKDMRKIVVCSLLGLVVLGLVGALVYTLAFPDKVAKITGHDKLLNKPVEYHEQKATIIPEKPTADKIFELVNKERTQRGIAPLARVPEIDNVTRLKVEDMIKNDYYAHRNPKTGRGLIDQTYVDNHCKEYGENINQDEYWTTRPEDHPAEDHVKEWMESTDGHREAILNPRFKYAGLALGWRTENLFVTALLFVNLYKP
jgi:SCP-like extracellular